MTLLRWGSSLDPLVGLRQLRRDLERMAWPWTAGSRQVGGGSYPPVNVYTSPGEILVQCELAGVEPGDIDVSITGETLTIKGAKKPQEDAEKVKFIQRELGCGEFTRTIVLPDVVDAGRIEASLRDGVLNVRLPKAAAAQPRQIEVRPYD